ncbi:cilia- and flagella-associated protein 69-like [Photinus pyralis]|nr:cilia- and flagella-associated protein 69-like [Photinus pyralis]
MSEHGDSNSCECESEKVVLDQNCPQNLQWIVRKLAFLMHDEIATHQLERQTDLLDKFIHLSPRAFWLHDIPYIIKILEHLFKHINTFCLFKPRLKSLLNLAIVPPLLERASDVLELGRDLDEYCSFLGYMLIEVQEVELRDLILLAITNLVRKIAPIVVNSVPHQALLQSVERSQLPTVVTKLLELADEDLFDALLDICWLFVKISDAVCHQMIQEDALDYILTRINLTSANFVISCKIIWRLLEASRNETDRFKRNLLGPSREALRCLQSLLRTLTNNNNQIYRNFIMSVILHCMDLFPNLQLNLSGLANDIGVLCSATEFGTGGTWITNVTFGTNDYDYEFKKMLLLAICYCSKLPLTLKIVHPKRIIPSLIRILTPELSKPWLPDQQVKLISMAINALHMVAQAVPNEFLNSNGPLRMLSMIERFNVQPYDLLLLRDCLKSINAIATMKHKEICTSFVNHDAFNILTVICDKLLSLAILSLNSQECLTYAFCALESLIFVKPKKWGNVIDLCTKLLGRVLTPHVQDPVINPKLVICGLDFLWEAVAWDDNNLQAFVGSGGVYLLLDLISASAFPIKVVGLGLLVELCDAGTGIPYLITWRNSGQPLFPALLTIFRDECMKMGVRTSYDGTVSDVEFPLMGQQQWYETFGIQKDLYSTPAIVDLLGSCRPKVYAIINLLYNRHNLSVDIANEHYCMFNLDNLKTEDKITLHLAENFLALKLGETWMEVSRDLENAGVLPLAIDTAFVTQLTRRFHNWSQHIRISQEKLLEQEFLEEYNTEMDFYKLLRESKLIESLQALHELRYIARTTERMFRFAEKTKQCRQAERFGNFSANAIPHRTFMHDIKVTTVFKQRVSIQSKQNCNWDIPTPITDSEENENIPTARFSDSLESESD